MAYSIVGIIAIFVHIIVNIDVFFRKGGRNFPGGNRYLFFLLAVILYHITDGFWGFLYDAKSVVGVIIDTSVYFVAMGLSILLWGLFVTKYLESESKLIKPMLYIGYAVFAIQIVAIIVNLFPTTRILFSVTEECEYSAGPLRYATLILQIVMFVLIGLYTLSVIINNRGISKKKHLAILFFCVGMIIFVTLQVIFPLLPMYSFGYLFGVTAIHTFVLEEQKVERQHELEEAKFQIGIDALTGTKSKHAYVDMEVNIDKRIASNEMPEFAIAVFDLNDLKVVNDTYGHEAGDLYIIAATKLISQIFSQSEIYRIGGDEFAAILLDEDYNNRDELAKEFNKNIQKNIKRRGVVASLGISAYIQGKDNTFVQVFNRADKEMYQRKHDLKESRE